MSVSYKGSDGVVGLHKLPERGITE